MFRQAQFALFASCVAATVAQATHAAAAPDAPAPTQTYWYSGGTKAPLYRQPQLYVPRDGHGVPPGAPRIATRQNVPPVYELASSNAGHDRSALTVYSTMPDWRGARLLVRAPGVLFTLGEGTTANGVQQWLAARGLQALPIADGAAFKIEGIAGEAALDLANALYESALVRSAQPNWVSGGGER
ncbi:MAG: hypothetical protein ACTHKH_11275 [Trinickia sp.]